MEDDKLWSDYIPADILGLISSRLVAGEYFAFRAVCKKWRYAPPPHPPPPYRVHYDSPLPCLMTLHEKTGVVELFHPVYNMVTTRNTGIHKLRGSRIRSSKASWLLMSHGNRGMFFFNPISNDIIELPDLLEEDENSCCAWTFSCPPDSSSSDCFVVGFDYYGSPPCVYMIKVGETKWTYHYFDDEDGYNKGNSQLIGCNNPIFFKNNVVYVLGDKGNLGTLSIKENSATEPPTWKFHGRHFRSRKRKSIRHVYTAEDADNEAMLAVFLMHQEGEVEVWRYKINGREKITSLDNKTLFVSYGGAYLKPCVAQGLQNKIYFPMFHDSNKGVFYCLISRKYYSFDYSVIKVYSSPNIFNLAQPRSSIWIEPRE